MLSIFQLLKHSFTTLWDFFSHPEKLEKNDCKVYLEKYTYENIQKILKTKRLGLELAKMDKEKVWYDYRKNVKRI